MGKQRPKREGEDMDEEAAEMEQKQAAVVQRRKTRIAAGLKHTRQAALKVLPYFMQLGASMGTYAVGITATQIVGYCLRISCRTPVLGPCLGLLGVGAASALAGHVSAHTGRLCREGGNPLKLRWWRPMQADEAVVDALLGLLVFKASGGRFSSVMPSDLSAPGALAFESIPAQGGEYAGPGAKRELARIFRRDGCHHCGTRRGPVIGDHMPPNKLVYSRGRSQLAAWWNELPVIRQIRALARPKGARPPPPQRFYPQCQRCSIKQATAMRHSKRRLVLHMHAPRHRSDQLTGVLVGLRHNVPPLQDPAWAAAAAPAGAARARTPPRWNPVGLTAALAAPEAALAPLLLTAGGPRGASSGGGGGGGALVHTRCSDLDYSPTAALGAGGAALYDDEDSARAAALSLPAVRDPAPASPAAPLGGAGGAFGGRGGAAASASASGPGGGFIRAARGSAGGAMSRGASSALGGGSDAGVYSRRESAIGADVYGAAADEAADPFGSRDGAQGEGGYGMPEGAAADGGCGRRGGAAADGGFSTVPGASFGRGGDGGGGDGGRAAAAALYGVGPVSGSAAGEAPARQPRGGADADREWRAEAAAAGAGRWGPAAAAGPRAGAVAPQPTPEVAASFQTWVHTQPGGGAAAAGGHYQRGAGGQHGSPPGGAARARATQAQAGEDAAPYLDAAQQVAEGLKQRAARAALDRHYARGASYD